MSLDGAALHVAPDDVETLAAEIAHVLVEKVTTDIGTFHVALVG